MKKIIKHFSERIIPMFLLILIFVLVYGFIHEFSHYIACNLVGLDGKISIDLLQNPPKYQASCDGLNEKTIFDKFLFWGSPYIVSFVLLLCFLLFWKWKNFYTLSIPLGIVMSDIFNLLGFYQWFFGAGQIENDLFQIAFKLPKFYIIVLLVIIVVNIGIFIIILKESLIAESKKGSIKLRRNNSNKSL